MLNNHRFKIWDLIHVYRSPSVDTASLWVAKQSWFSICCISKLCSAEVTWLYSQTKFDDYQVHGGQGDNQQSEWPVWNQFSTDQRLTRFHFCPVDLGLAFQIVYSAQLPQAGFLQKSHGPDAEILPKVAFPAKTTDVT